MTHRSLFAPFWAAFALSLALFLGGCPAKEEAPPGGANGKPLVLGFVPSLEADKIAENAQPMADFLSKELAMPVETFTSTNYTGLVEAMGANKVDVAAFAPFAYVLANDQNGAELLAKVSRKGLIVYHATFWAKTDSGINTIEDAKGKSMAFVDAASASGYLFPSAYLKGKGYDPENYFAETKFAGSHDNAIRSVYNGDVAVCVAYDTILDRMEKEFPDVRQKVKEIGRTEDIPNDVFAARKDLTPELKAKIKAALLKYAATPEGKETLRNTYDIDGLVEAKDEDYQVVRDTAKLMGVTLQRLDEEAKEKAAKAAEKAKGGK